MSRSRARKSSTIAESASLLPLGLSSWKHSTLGRVLTYGFIVGNNPINDWDPLGLASKTHFNMGGIRVDSEVPTAGAGTGGVHIQFGGGKYQFDTRTGGFVGLPNKLAKELEKNDAMRRAIKNAVNRVNCEGGGFAPGNGGGLGRYVPLIAAALALANGTIHAEEIGGYARDYFDALRSDDILGANEAASLFSEKLNEVAPGAGSIVLGGLVR